MIIVSTLFKLKTDYKNVKLFLNMRKMAVISDDYHDIGRLLFLTIIFNSKNWTISIIVNGQYGKPGNCPS